MLAGRIGMGFIATGAFNSFHYLITMRASSDSRVWCKARWPRDLVPRFNYQGGERGIDGF